MNPTFEVRAGFAREFARLSREQDRTFRKAVRKLVDALGDEREPPRSLRIKDMDDALANAGEAVALYVEGLREDGESLDMGVVRRRITLPA